MFQTHENYLELFIPYQFTHFFLFSDSGNVAEEDKKAQAVAAVELPKAEEKGGLYQHFHNICSFS